MTFTDLENEYNLYLTCSRHNMVDDVNRELTAEEIAEFRTMFQTLSQAVNDAKIKAKEKGN